MICLCGRQPMGFAWHDFSQSPFDRQPPVHCCSTQCLDIAHALGGDMKKISVDESRAIHAASEAIGQYLEKIGKSDLATMTEAEWIGFLGHAYGSICEEVRAIWSREVPF